MEPFIDYKRNAKRITFVLAIVAGLAALIVNIDTIYKTIHRWANKASPKLVVERVFVVPAAHCKADEFGSWKLKLFTTAEFIKAYSSISLANGRFPKYVIYHYNTDKFETGGGGVAASNDAGIFLYHLIWSFDTDEQRLNYKNLNRAIYRQLERDLRHPEIRIVIRNNGDKTATFYGVNSINLCSYGGEAGAGGAQLEPVNSDKTININYANSGYLKFKSPIILDPGDVTLFAIVPVVIDAAQGDGPGGIIVNWTLDYHDGIKNSIMNVGNFGFRDSIMELSHSITSQ